MAVKRIFYVTSNELSAVFFDGGRVNLLGKFQLTDEGIEGFSDLVSQDPDHPTAFIVDVIEEEFRVENVPYANGSDRVNLLERKTNALFHNAKYTSAQVLGRSKEGRRDNNVLFSALNNAEVLERWHKVTKNARVPLAGVYSVPMLTGMLVRKLKIGHPNTLFLSVQNERLLRQSFFKKGKLKLSRLTRLNTLDDDDFLKNLLNEVSRNKRYLERLQLIDFNQPLEVYILTEGEQLEILRAGCHDDEKINYHLLDLNEISSRLGIKQTLGADECEWCYASLLNTRKPVGNYIRPNEQTYYTQFNLRKMIVGASLASAVFMTSWGGMDIYAGQELAVKTAQIEVQARQISAEIARKDKSYLDSNYEPQVMRAVVEINDVLTAHKPDPLETLSYIGSSLNKHPNIVLDKIMWGKIQKPAAEMMEGDENVSDVLVDTATINGRLKVFPGSYQAAFQQVDALLATLRSNDQVMSAKAISLPVDINPATTLIGESRYKDDAKQARFELEIRFKDGERDV